MTDRTTYETLRDGFRWDIPERYNIAVDTIDRHAAARPDDLALIFEDEAGTVERHSFDDLRRASNRLANVLVGTGSRGGGSGRHPAAAGARDGHRPPRRLPRRLHRRPAVRAVRTRCDRVPADRLGRHGVDHRPRRLAQGRRDPRSPAGPADDHRRRGPRRRRDTRLRRLRCRRVRRLRDRRHRRRRPGDHHLHLGHDRPTEGRPARPPIPARPPAGRAVAAGVPAAAGRPVLDACRLGLDRRAVRHRLPGLALGHPGPCPPVAAVRPGARLRSHGATSGHQRLPAADGVEAHAPLRGAAGRGSRLARGGERRESLGDGDCSTGAGRPWA